MKGYYCNHENRIL